MNTDLPALKIEIVWFDDDMLELRLDISNAGFAGKANFYAALNEPAIFAKSIEGFPKDITDVREYEFGGTNLPGYGGAKIRLYCKDGSGHLILQVSVYKNPDDQKLVAESATVRFQSVPAAIDAFVVQLQRMRTQIGEVAVLQNAT